MYVSTGQLICILVMYLTCDFSDCARARLVGGRTPNSGRVEIYYDSTWGTVCDDEWDDDDADVVCRMLGYTNGKAYGSAYFGQGSGRIWLDNLDCDGYERSVWSCGGNSWGDHNCGHSEDAGAWCANTGYELALLPGKSRNVGTLLVSLHSQWGTVCDDSFDTREADVACRELGYSNGGVAYVNGALGQGTGNIWLDDLQCTGTESKLSLCSHRGWGVEDCSHSEDAGVYCYKGSWSSWSSCSVTCGGGTRTRRISCTGSDSSSYCRSRTASASCNTQLCPVHGQWGSWNALGTCSVTCSIGTRPRTRSCNNPTPANGGRPCYGTSIGSVSCNSGVRCPVNGQWSGWNAWGSCSVTCASGTRTRSRRCNNPAPAYGGLSCIGTSVSSKFCNSGVQCPVNGQWGSWNDWGSCSVSCANGTRTRSRRCNNPAPAFGGMSCTGTSVSSKFCHSGVQCPVDGQWAHWEAWSSCSVTCENGISTRVRNCSNPAPAYGGQNCTGDEEETNECTTGIPCQVDGHWASWEIWSACSVTCENGTRARVRNCSDPAPAYGGQNCTGDEEEADKCVTGIPCPVDGHWASWELWSACSVTCENGTRERVRNCSDPAPVYGGQNCTGDEEEADKCVTGVPCPVNGHWASWEIWSACSVTCENGTRARVRNCSDPAPIYGGQNCTGDEEEADKCVTGVPCPVDGHWASWEIWSSCSVTCDNGTRARVRNCSDPAPVYGGQNCTGDEEESEPCMIGLSCPVDGQWAIWEAWSSCTVTCENGTRARVRDCSDPAPAYGGQNCTGDEEEADKCVTGIPCPVDGHWASWELWSACSVTCENGTRERVRNCSDPAPVYGGQNCTGDEEEADKCVTGVPCPVNGHWASWEIWSACSVTCENGTRARVRNCSDPAPIYGGQNCTGDEEEADKCVTGVPCPVDGHWASWEIWSSCSVTCDNGTRARVRNCSDPAPVYGGQNCTGDEEESEPCMIGLSCPVDGQWAIWEAWSSCTVTCENGTRARVRDCSDPAPAYGGQNCTGDEEEADKCVTGIPCPVDGHWASWELWSACSVTCENGTRERVRNCSDPAPVYGGQNCTGDEEEADKCVTGVPCPVNGHWASWEIWSACSVTCENGTRARVRNCSDPAPIYGGQNCTGDEEEADKCVTGVPCPVDGHWASWEIWSSCSVTCDNGTRARVRNCSDPAPVYGGQNCTGDEEESEPCMIGLSCPVDGQWAIWEAWSSCTVTCENGTRARVRDCSDPAPAHGGQNCTGDEEEADKCGTGIPCPVDGHWASWELWSACSVTCENGTRERVRNCSDPAPVYGGQNCTGDEEEADKCVTGVPCPVNGHWASWEIWSACSVTCENGTRARVRNCSDPAPIYGGQNCTGDEEEADKCVTGVPCPVDGHWASWEIWSSCSVTCDNGTRARVRNCSDPAPVYGGQNCTGDEEESEPCMIGLSCPVDGQWAIWEAWSSCTVTCENGTRARVRDCSDPAPAYGGQNCTGDEEEADKCGTGIPCPVDGHWASWELWSACSVTCENGTRERVRNCSDPAPVYGGQNCTGDEEEADKCVTGVPCPVNGHWASWEIWSACSVTCENGTRARVRNCSDPAPIYGGQNCTGDEEEADKCVTGVPCPVDGHWASWEIWSSCSVTCDNGTRARVRNCSDPAPVYGGQNCTGDEEESEPCMIGLSCPVDGQWAIWEAWSSCTVTCENGTRARVRDCSDPAPAYGGQNCTGDEEEADKCGTGIPCPVDGHWASWELWSACSVTCENGTRERVRNCSDPAPVYGGQNCTGDEEEADKCVTGVPCPVNGHWASWEIWSACSVTCENGTRARVRNCSDPAPIYGGQNCTGDEEEADKCVTGVPCPVDGHWASWEIWSSCSVTCDNGTRARVRNCSDPAPVYGGQNCTGDEEESEPCMIGLSCPVDGQWAIWEAWSSCTVTCENGTRARVRDCSDPAPAYGGQNCSGVEKETNQCVTDTLCPVDGHWASWTEWSSCSVTCENGTRARVRDCNDPAPSYGGESCNGDKEETDNCATDVPCPVDGHWASWELWSACSMTCGNGTRARVRNCSDPVPAHGGQECTGNNLETEPYATGIPCQVDGHWASWELWSACSVTCDNGTRARVRNCSDPTPAYGGQNCTGNEEETESCATNTHCRVIGQWENWMEWSACSVTCECGYKHRSRDCSPLAIENTAPFCNGSSNETKICNTNILCPGACGDGNMMCFDKRTCITSEMSCDGVGHCPGGEDELHCLENQLFYSVPIQFPSSGTGTPAHHRYQGILILFLLTTVTKEFVLT